MAANKNSTAIKIGTGLAIGFLAYKVASHYSNTNSKIIDTRLHDEEELDDAGLANRVLRKAETVIQGGFNASTPVPHNIILMLLCSLSSSFSSFSHRKDFEDYIGG